MRCESEWIPDGWPHLPSDHLREEASLRWARFGSSRGLQQEAVFHLVGTIVPQKRRGHELRNGGWCATAGRTVPGVATRAADAVRMRLTATRGGCILAAISLREGGRGGNTAGLRTDSRGSAAHRPRGLRMFIRARGSNRLRQSPASSTRPSPSLHFIVSIQISASLLRREKSAVRPSRVRRGGPITSRLTDKIFFTCFVRMSTT